MIQTTISTDSVLPKKKNRYFLVGLNFLFLGPFLLAFALMGILLCITTNLLSSPAKIPKDPTSFTSPNNIY